MRMKGVALFRTPHLLRSQIYRIEECDRPATARTSHPYYRSLG